MAWCGGILTHLSRLQAEREMMGDGIEQGLSIVIAGDGQAGRDRH